MVLGSTLVLPVLRLKPSSSIKSSSHARFSRYAPPVSALRDVYGIARGLNYRQPSAFALSGLIVSGAAVLWLAGTTIPIALAFGACLGAGLLARWFRIVKNRNADLNEFWPNYLDQTRSKMRSSSRALPYVLFDESLIGTTFQMELLQAGRREFENSGDLRKALHRIWESADHNMTSFVCSALCDLLGSTSHQIEEQMKVIVATLRSHNALEREAKSKLAGVRAARAFIVIIPTGMALAGLSFAGSVAPFTTATSLAEMAAALAILAGCWYWSSRLMIFPSWPARKFPSSTEQPT